MHNYFIERIVHFFYISYNGMSVLKNIGLPAANPLSSNYCGSVPFQSLLWVNKQVYVFISFICLHKWKQTIYIEPSLNFEKCNQQFHFTTLLGTRVSIVSV